jgi:8-oxo-dGTP pyrophosphatase MutT (NUDIX family)
MTAAVKPLLVNEGEFKTDAALRAAAEELGYRVSPKVRVADALAIERSGLSTEAFSYALRSHFDWVVADLQTMTPEFAVEFDGLSHDGSDAQRRDLLKDEICRHLDFPLLRIDRSGFRPAVRRTVIGYLVESWALMKGFFEAQATGQIPEDEIFMPWAVVEAVDDRGRITWRDLAQPCRILVERLFSAGLITVPSPTYAYRGRRPEDPHHAEAYAWVVTSTGQLVIGHARIRAYSFPAVLDSELADDLAHMDLADRLARWREGDDSVLVVLEDAHLPNRFPGSGWSGGGVVSVGPKPA